MFTGMEIDVCWLQFFILIWIMSKNWCSWSSIFYFVFQILMFDSVNGRTCLHYAAYYGHSDCLQAILSAAHSSHVAASWWVLSTCGLIPTISNNVVCCQRFILCIIILWLFCCLLFVWADVCVSFELIYVWLK